MGLVAMFMLLGGLLLSRRAGQGQGARGDKHPHDLGRIVQAAGEGIRPVAVSTNAPERWEPGRP
jgi:hypothetical protein